MKKTKSRNPTGKSLPRIRRLLSKFKSSGRSISSFGLLHRTRVLWSLFIDISGRDFLKCANSQNSTEIPVEKAIWVFPSSMTIKREVKKRAFFRQYFFSRAERFLVTAEQGILSDATWAAASCAARVFHAMLIIGELDPKNHHFLGMCPKKTKSLILPVFLPPVGFFQISAGPGRNFPGHSFFPVEKCHFLWQKSFYLNTRHFCYI